MPCPTSLNHFKTPGFVERDPWKPPGSGRGRASSLASVPTHARCHPASSRRQVCSAGLWMPNRCDGKAACWINLPSTRLTSSEYMCICIYRHFTHRAPIYIYMCIENRSDVIVSPTATTSPFPTPRLLLTDPGPWFRAEPTSSTAWQRRFYSKTKKGNKSRLRFCCCCCSLQLQETFFSS